MATSSIEATKVLCVVCHKGKGIYRCEGCSGIFCYKHSNDHRNELNAQLEEVAVSYDLIQQILNQQPEDPQQHPLIKKIDQWENESIIKVRQAAEKARNELLKGTTRCTTQVKQKLQILSNELKEGRNENDFSEIDLRQWTQKLEELKKRLVTPTTITIEEDSTPLITNIRVTHQDTLDVFERICGTGEIKENGCLVLKDNLRSHTEIRGKNEYNTGIHPLRFQVEQLAQGGWIFFGIINKSEPMQNYSFNSSSCHGWSNRSQIYDGDNCTYGITTETTQNDVIELLIDCDQRKISLKNIRLNEIMELLVDINKCRFPWQLLLNLYDSNTHVRILKSSD